MKTKFLSETVAFTITLFLVGCEINNPYTGYPTTLVSFPVDIVSKPSGAVIEINDNYMGKTPLTVELRGWEATRTFARSHTIVAHPVAPGGQTQVKVFTGWSEPSETYGDTIPTKIFFNMNLIRIPEKLEIDIDN